MELGLEGTAALVTGAGPASARRLPGRWPARARAWRALPLERRPGERLAAEIDGVALQADLRDEAAADALVPAAVERSAGSTRAWRTPARGIRRTSRSPGMPLERWRDTIESNLTATFLTARAYLRHVAGAGAGSLVLVGSTSGIFGEAGHADYSSAKAAMTHGLLPTLKNEIVGTRRSGA